MKFVALHMMAVVATFAGLLWFGNRNMSPVVSCMPVLVAAMPLLAAPVAWFRRASRWAVTCLLSGLVATVVAVPASLLTIYAAGMAQVGGMRY